LGIAYVNEGMYHQGVAALKEAISIDPNLATAHMNLGLAYTKLGMLDEALKEFEDALRLDPKYAKVYYNLAHITKRAITQRQSRIVIGLWP